MNHSLETYYNNNKVYHQSSTISILFLISESQPIPPYVRRTALLYTLLTLQIAFSFTIIKSSRPEAIEACCSPR